MTTSSFTLPTRRNDEEVLLAYYADTMQGLGADFSLMRFASTTIVRFFLF